MFPAFFPSSFALQGLAISFVIARFCLATASCGAHCGSVLAFRIRVLRSSGVRISQG
jgi:hypothetical protein